MSGTAIGRREGDPFLQPLEADEWERRSEKLSVHFRTSSSPWAAPACWGDAPGTRRKIRPWRSLPFGVAGSTPSRSAFPTGGAGGERSPEPRERVLPRRPSS